MDAYLVWLASGFVLVIAELLSGMFFLLVLGVAALAASVAAWFGLGYWLQVSCAAVIAIAGVFWARQQRKAMQRPDMALLDVGQAVTLDAWVDRQQGAARVEYRNTLWDAKVVGERDFDRGQVLIIEAVDGSTLKVSKAKA